MGDDELVALRVQLTSVLEVIAESSVAAQMAVNRSPNELEATASHASAVELSTRASQQVTDLFEIHTVGGVQADLLRARLAYREAVTDEDNPSIADPQVRAIQCTRIEKRCNEFHSIIRDQAFKRWGVGVGAKAGKMRGRRDPV